MNTTRDADLELLELARDKENNQARKAKNNALLESVYLQAKDPYLEKIRKELQYWIVYGLSNAPDEGCLPTPAQIKILAEAEINIERLEKLAQAYAKSPAFQTEMLRRMNRHDPQRVEALVAKQKRRLT